MQRDVRVRKGAISDAFAAWENTNLKTLGSGYTLGVEKIIKRRRRSAIIDFI